MRMKEHYYLLYIYSENENLVKYLVELEQI